MQKTINSTEFRKMVVSGARMLEINRAKVDSLNVFPVPDGDTGTNMSLTLQSAVKEMNGCSSNRFQEICDAVSKGALKGARGSSGVISAQIFRGICSVLKAGSFVILKNSSSYERSGKNLLRYFACAIKSNVLPVASPSVAIIQSIPDLFNKSTSIIFVLRK